ncbi:MAG: MoaD/ThiS family protein [bacterium]
MAIKVLIPSVLQKLTQGESEVEVRKESCYRCQNIENVGDLIEELDATYPGIKERLCDEEGKIRRFINIFVNGEDIRFLNQDKTEIKDNGEVSIIPAITGG